ncbi:MAG: transketolase family protein, partial [Candidatus Pacebacteria bacterium]|nr:transketolase family protein [Candidatus Paceibacterota bacterium]
AIRAAKDLDDEGVRVRVLNLSTIKPMDIDAVVKLGTQTGKIVIIEECQTVGGVGSAVAEVLAQIAPAKMRFIGACDMSGISDGRMPHPGIDIENIKNTIRELYVQ